MNGRQTVTTTTQDEHIERELERVTELLRKSAMFRAAIKSGAKADVVLYVNSHHVLDRGPHVREV